MPSFCTMAAASKTARACISEISGKSMPRRQPRRPSIGLNSCSCSTRRWIFSTGTPHLLRQFRLLFRRVRQKLVQRRIEEADRRRKPLPGPEDAGEVVPLIRKQLGQRRFPRLERLGENHLAHGVDTVALEEHVLGPAETDANGAKRDGVPRLFGRVGIGAHRHAGRVSHHFISCWKLLNFSVFLAAASPSTSPARFRTAPSPRVRQRPSLPCRRSTASRLPCTFCRPP